MKPGEFTNRGKGITVCSHLEEIVGRLKGKQKNADGSVRTFILQKYLQKKKRSTTLKLDLLDIILVDNENNRNNCVKNQKL